MRFDRHTHAKLKVDTIYGFNLLQVEGFEVWCYWTSDWDTPEKERVNWLMSRNDARHMIHNAGDQNIYDSNVGYCRGETTLDVYADQDHSPLLRLIASDPARGRFIHDVRYCRDCGEEIAADDNLVEIYCHICAENRSKCKPHPAYPACPVCGKGVSFWWYRGHWNPEIIISQWECDHCEWSRERVNGRLQYDTRDSLNLATALKEQE